MEKTKRVLIVDDEPDLLKAVAFRVQKAGYNVVLASDGGEALEKARTKGSDLIVLDQKLPVMDGTEVCKKLKSDDSLKDIPVIFLTASSAAEFLERLRKDTDIEYVITKPYEAEELLSKIKELIG